MKNLAQSTVTSLSKKSDIVFFDKTPLSSQASTSRLKVALLMAFIFMPLWQISSLQAETQIETTNSRQVLIRPFAGISYTDGADLGQGNTGNGTGYHVGARLMLSANKIQSYGIEYTYMDLYGLENNGPDVRYSAIGLVIEQALYNEKLLMTIGTVGYFGIGDNTDNPFGLRANVGWESEEINKIKFFIVVRSDHIFDRETISVHSLSTGMRLEF